MKEVKQDTMGLFNASLAWHSSDMVLPRWASCSFGERLLYSGSYVFGISIRCSGRVNEVPAMFCLKPQCLASTRPSFVAAAAFHSTLYSRSQTPECCNRCCNLKFRAHYFVSRRPSTVLLYGAWTVNLM